MCKKGVPKVNAGKIKVMALGGEEGFTWTGYDCSMCQNLIFAI